MKSSVTEKIQRDGYLDGKKSKRELVSLALIVKKSVNNLKLGEKTQRHNRHLKRI